MRRLFLMVAIILALMRAVSAPALAHVPVESNDPSGARDQDGRQAARCVAPAGWPVTRRWIEVSLQEHVVRLCDGSRPWREYLAATGIGDRPETTTYTGLFAIYEMSMGPLYLGEYDVFVTDWVGFDREHHNGFHSLPMDAGGRVLDDRLGQAVSHGCVRMPQPNQLWEFAEFGMSVWVH